MAYSRKRVSYRPSYGRLFNYGLKFGHRMYKQWIQSGGGQSSFQNKNSSGVQYTTQRDVKVQYRRKRMPRRKRRAWGRFVKKVVAANMKTIGTNTVVRNSNVTSSSVAAGQEWCAIHLYGATGTDSAQETGTDDCSAVNAQDTRITNTSKVIFGSAILDSTIRNSGNTDLEVDLYELTYGNEANFASLGSMLSFAQSQTANIPGSLSGLTINNRGVTLFDIPQFIKCAKVKILKKTKVFLPAGETTNYQIRLSKNMIYNMFENADGVATYSNAYKTRTLFAVHKPVVGFETSTLTIGVTRKYMYKITEDSEDYDASY